MLSKVAVKKAGGADEREIDIYGYIQRYMFKYI